MFTFPKAALPTSSQDPKKLFVSWKGHAVFLVKIELSLEPLAEHSEQAKYVFTPVAQLALPLPPSPGFENGNVISPGSLFKKL